MGVDDGAHAATSQFRVPAGDDGVGLAAAASRLREHSASLAVPVRSPVKECVGHSLQTLLCARVSLAAPHPVTRSRARTLNMPANGVSHSPFAGTPPGRRRPWRASSAAAVVIICALLAHPACAATATQTASKTASKTASMTASKTAGRSTSSSMTETPSRTRTPTLPPASASGSRSSSPSSSPIVAPVYSLPTDVGIGLGGYTVSGPEAYTTDRCGNVGGALSASGGLRVTPPAVAAARVPSGNAPRTLAAWVLCMPGFNPFGDYNEFLGTGPGNSGFGRRFSLGVVGSSLAHNGYNYDWRTSAPVCTNRWTHVAATFDGASLALYVNGTALGSVARTFATVASVHHAWNGADTHHGGEVWTGAMDDVAIYNVSLSAVQVRVLAGAPCSSGSSTSTSRTGTLSFTETRSPTASLSTGASSSPPPAYVFNNGRLRFGTGSESMVNSAGNLRQPFYRSARDGAWHKLTYSSYPLDMALGLDNDNAASWAGTHVGDFYDLPVNSSADDSSQFVETSQVGDLHYGHGNFTTCRTFAYRGAQFTVTNTYRLGATASFVQIDTTTTNVGSTTMWNARLWVGTRDDWVWTDDRNTKTRGNLMAAGFVPLASPADACNALLVSNAISETVLLYTTTPGANMV